MRLCLISEHLESSAVHSTKVSDSWHLEVHEQFETLASTSEQAIWHCILWITIEQRRNDPITMNWSHNFMMGDYAVMYPIICVILTFKNSYSDMNKGILLQVSNLIFVEYFLHYKTEIVFECFRIILFYNSQLFNLLWKR